jgi:hypothetical protein
MTNSKTISLNHAKDVFPAKYTKVRSHDLISRSISQAMFLTKKEQEAMQNIAAEMRTSFGGRSGINQDMIAIRDGKKIKFEPLFDEK